MKTVIDEALATAAEVAQMGGVCGKPVRFRVSYEGHEWHANKVGDEILLLRHAISEYSGLRYQHEHHLMLAEVEETVGVITRLRDYDGELGDLTQYAINCAVKALRITRRPINPRRNRKP